MSQMLTTAPCKAIQGRVRVPGDKSMSHRSIMLGSLADGTTHVSGFLNGEDCLATMAAFRAMGVNITQHDDTTLSIDGVGMHGLKAAAEPLDMGNSGTAMRLMAGLLVGQHFDSTLVGDSSLSKRPMRRITDPLQAMGGQLKTQEDGTPPIQIKAGANIKGMAYGMPMASAQVKSAVLLAGLYAEGETSVTEPAVTRDHTERMLGGFNYSVKREGPTASLVGGDHLTACAIDIPADISSAAFFMVAASIVPGADIVLEHVGINPSRTGVIDILKLMGANIELFDERSVGGEPVADIRVQYAGLKGIRIPENLIPLAIDEFPVLFVAACCAEGTTTLVGAEELRVKESDRIQVMADGLASCGADVTATPDGMIIRGGRTLHGAEIDSVGDHRIAMSFCIAGAVATSAITIKNADTVATSFPNFVELATQLGMQLEMSV